MTKRYWIGLFLVCLTGLLCVSCRRHTVPRPYGYYRIAIPDTAYQPLSKPYPYTFALSANAEVREHTNPKERYWIEVHYPSLNADIHCSYKPVQGNLRALTDDAIEFVYKHAQIASAIPEKEFANPEANVYGVLFTLQGNTASPYQFFLTDSTRHFFRGAVYCNCPVNPDSLAPVFEYLQTDVTRLMETFAWQ